MPHKDKQSARQSKSARPADTEANYADRLTLDAKALDIRIDDVGRLRFPLTARKARALADKGQPAPFGLGTETRFDKSVRDVAEIPASQVHIAADTWNAALTPALDQLRRSLGLAPGRLSAKLDKLLVYSTGQFFKPHQDSERGDTMIGTLVVVLPSAHKGGALIIEHQSESRRLLSAHVKPSQLVLFGFYADCRHEIRPVTEGYRVVLSHELHYEADDDRAVAQRYRDSDGEKAGTTLSDDGDDKTEAAAQAPEADLEEENVERDMLATILTHFFNPERLEGLSTYRRPNKLVCLLDHEYSQRSLGWNRLKGHDATWGTLLREACASHGFRVYLTLAEVTDTWDAQEPERPRWRQRSRYDYYADDDEQNDDHVSLEASTDVEVGELIDRGAHLSEFRDEHDRRFSLPSLSVMDVELHHRDGIESFQPDSEEYEGWMGNYGNTVERQYHRAAVVLWPAANHYPILLRSNPGTLIQELADDTANDPAAAAEQFHALGNDWPPRSLIEDDSALKAALRMSVAVNDTAFSLTLLSGFRLLAFTRKRLPGLIALGEQHGADFCQRLVDRWTEDDSTRYYHRHGTDSRFERLPWVQELAHFHFEASKADTHAWSGQSERLGLYFIAAIQSAQEASNQSSPSSRRRALKSDESRWNQLIDAIVQIATDSTNTRLCEALDQTLDAALPELALAIAERLLESDAEVLGKHRLSNLMRRIEASLANRESMHARLSGDWRLPFSSSCTCADCKKLTVFLHDSGLKALDWPLAKKRRQHIHGSIDHAELPVSHRTRRQGSPHVLELRKLDRLFKDDARELVRIGKLRARLTELMRSR